MKFEERAIKDSEGWTLAHSIKCGPKRVSKGTLITNALISELLAASVEKAQVFLLERGDLDENQAAKLAAKSITGSGLRVELAGRGRANIISTQDGLFMPGDAIDAVNITDDAFSAASLASHTPVRAGQLVATIKLVPYGLPAGKLDNIRRTKVQLVVKSFQEFSATLLVTGETLNERTIASLTSRIERVKGQLKIHPPIPHNKFSVTTALEKAKREGQNLILMLGASAISDERDIFPAALCDAGGDLIKLGMPADPGNLLMLGKLGGQTVIGLPGCARSPALNGFDWVLERFAAQEPLDAQVITKMGTGGLLKEPVGRTIPRSTKAGQPISQEQTIAAAVVLAAGKSSRSQNAHKLLSMLGGKTVVRTTVDILLAVKGLSVLVVTGYRAQEIQESLPAKRVSVVHNSNFEQGMGTSLAAGIKKLEGNVKYAFVCLGDMPFVQLSTLEKMLVTAGETKGTVILVPTFHGKRGHPVLWHQSFFTDLKQLRGDAGGKKILRDNFEKIVEVPVDDPGILIDLDTPEMLAQFGVMPKGQ